MMQQGRVITDSDWNDVQEADVGITLLEMFANVADQLSYYQDRVSNEAFLSKASRQLKISKNALRSVLHTARAVDAITSATVTRQLRRWRTRRRRIDRRKTLKEKKNSLKK